jgi:lysophospholipase L1-like esterase
MGNDSIEKDKAAPTGSKSGKIKRLLFWCLMVIIPLVIMELMAFAYLQFMTNKGPYRNNVGQVANPYHPYLGYVHAPNQTYDTSKAKLANVSRITTDENGHSVTPAFSYPNPDITIVVTGGSTIFGVGSTDNTTTVPSILERLINQRLNKRAEVLNLATRGFQSFQEMVLLDQFFAENQADIVFAISGRNDANQAIEDPTVEGAYLKKRIWNNAVSLVHRAERGEFMAINIASKLRSWSYTYDLLYRQIVPHKKVGSWAQSPELNLRKESATDLKKRARITATHFAAAAQNSKMNGADFVMILQPTPFFKSNLTAEENRNIATVKKLKTDVEIRAYRQKENEFYSAFRQVEKPFDLIDLSNIFLESRDTLYIDNCHYNDTGAELFAEKIFESVRPLLLKRE